LDFPSTPLDQSEFSPVPRCLFFSSLFFRGHFNTAIPIPPGGTRDALLLGVALLLRAVRRLLTIYFKAFDYFSRRLLTISFEAFDHFSRRLLTIPREGL